MVMLCSASLASAARPGIHLMGASLGGVQDEYGENQDRSDVGYRVRQKLSHQDERILTERATANGPEVLATQYLGLCATGSRRFLRAADHGLQSRHRSTLFGVAGTECLTRARDGKPLRQNDAVRNDGTRAKLKRPRPRFQQQKLCLPHRRDSVSPRVAYPR